MAQSGFRERLAAMVRTPGPWASVYVDASGDRSDPAGLEQSRRRSVQDELNRAGVPGALVEQIEEAMQQPVGMPSPVTRTILARADGIELLDVAPGAPPAEVAAWDALPLLVPLLQNRRIEMCYLVVQAGRDAGDIELYRTGSYGPEISETVQGRTDTLKKFQGGGWAHLRWQHHTEEIWKQNEAQLAAAVDALVLEHRPKLVVVSGDIRARQLLVDAFSTSTRELVAELPVNTRADGSDQSTLVDFVESQVERICQSELDAKLDRLQQELGRGSGGSAVSGVGWMVHALQQAQVDTLFLVPGGLGDRRLLALDDAPWVASAPEEAAGAAVIASVPAAEALVRAAILTDAHIRFVSESRLGAPVAALLRWPAEVTVTG